MKKLDIILQLARRLHGEIETKTLKRGKTPATYGLAHRGIDTIMSTIPANPEP